MTTDRGSALLIVDVQKDFCPGGALPVSEGERVVEALNRHIGDAVARGWPIYASRDWHPGVTRHFKDYGGDWPRHCVRDTAGAAFHDDLQLPASTIVVSKGQDAESHGYSAFEGLTSEGLDLLSDLKARRIEHLYIGGLATDYCVKHSVLDGLRAGLAVTLLGDAIAGVDLQPEDSARAVAAMREAGADVEP